MESLDRQVADGDNDAFENYSGANFYSHLGGTLYMNTQSATGFRHGIGLRFQNITIPKKATITNAYLTVICHIFNGGPINCQLGCQNSDNALDFNAWADVNTRYITLMTTAQTVWNSGIKADYEEFDSPDFSDSVQEVVNRSGWADGNALVVLTDPHLVPTDDMRIWAYEGSAAGAAKLHIEYTPFSPLGPKVQVI